MVIDAVKSYYSLRRSKKVFKALQKVFHRKKKVLDPDAKEKVLFHLERLQSAIQSKNAPDAIAFSEALKSSAESLMPRTFFERIFTSFSSLGVALLIAVVIRTMWFELYTIPTGSMRPTLKETDFLVVSKTNFGINVPLRPKHFYFDPDLVKRGMISVFTGENLDMQDADIKYFFLFPGKKILVKRLIGKPGDTLYFYGGKVYGVDQDGNEIREFLDSSWAQNLEHIPFIQLEGKTSVEGGRSLVFHQMNQPVGKLSVNVFGGLTPQMLSVGGKEPLENYSDLWGFKNYAMARLLTEKEAKDLYPSEMERVEKGVLYLELSHHPSLKNAKLNRTLSGGMRPEIGKSVSILPLSEKHLDRIMKNLVTCRFNVENGKAFPYSAFSRDPLLEKMYPSLSSVPNGTYEIQDGKAFKVYLQKPLIPAPLSIHLPGQAMTKELTRDHALYSKNPEKVQFFFNLGMNFLTPYQPGKDCMGLPSRYAYFKDGDLCMFNSSILLKGEKELEDFVSREKEKASLSYQPFVDQGAPLKADGKFDQEFIKKYGLKVPEKEYLMLGDNHAMSSDSRAFGFVPEDNLRGSVSFLFSPFGERFGSLPQPTKPFFVFPTLFILGLAFISISGVVYFRKIKNKSR